MSISGIKTNFNTIDPIIQRDKVERTEQPSGIKTFGEMLGQSMKEIQSLEGEADKQIEGIMTNKPGVTTHGAMIALEKADTAFQLMNTIRSKIIRAYEEILRTPI